eukprot:gnl/MRDRNA2_/MRDRNA2_15219_c0_seq1.p1 gnl/MRDRNA2_/MRDRNA2_15219_c0~~gnl/MRDRNA2_/MRDRNA2_15219_c0_seq1.p1  ORF type:complete len:247 (-),score=24.10 gnl/MRDRNA2_/MRDRNA2_15219_c0_seq1:150-890(-)
MRVTDIKGVFSFVATVSAFMLFLSPVKNFYRIVQDGRTAGFDHAPYLMTALQCGLWVSYGVFTPDRMALLLTNSIGLAISLIWWCVFAYYSSPATRVIMFKSMMCTFGVWLMGTLSDTMIVPLITSFMSEENQNTKLLGFICVAANIAMYISPLAVVRKVVTMRSVEFMPLPLSVMGLLSSSSWFMYSIFVEDIWIFIPNVLGVISGIVQLMIYTYYCRQSTRAGNRDMYQELSGSGTTELSADIA